MSSPGRTYDFVTRCEEELVKCYFDGNFEGARYFAATHPNTWEQFRGFCKDMMLHGWQPQRVASDYAIWLPTICTYEHTTSLAAQLAVKPFKTTTLTSTANSVPGVIYRPPQGGTTQATTSTSPAQQQPRPVAAYLAARQRRRREWMATKG